MPKPKVHAIKKDLVSRNITHSFSHKDLGGSILKASGTTSSIPMNS